MTIIDQIKHLALLREMLEEENRASRALGCIIPDPTAQNIIMGPQGYHGTRNIHLGFEYVRCMDIGQWYYESE